MNFVSVENIAKSYGAHQIFEGLSFGINEGQKTALVAKNGTGKTTLLRILVGEDVPDSGEINFKRGLKIGFLPQSPELDPELTVEQSIFDTDNEKLRVIRLYEEAILHPEDTENYQKAFDQMEAHRAWDFETAYKQILTELHLEDLEKRVKHLSGGQQKRLALARILLGEPDLLILDEPTNHLDLGMIEWLEGLFKKEKLTLFMVTHDRYFLERVCNQILELDEKKLYSYKGNYSYYLEKREERLALEKVNRDKARQLYKKELSWMRRQPKARGTKSKSRVDNVSEIQKRVQKRRDERTLDLEINMERLGAKIVELHNISKTFSDKMLFEGFDYNFQRGERLGIIGKNGSGKSTFLNILTGGLKPDTGKVVVGETVQFGYYHQAGIEVKSGQKVIEVIKEFGDYIPLKKGKKISAQQLLERFLFDRKKQFDYVEKLSGGEKKRLYLCTVLIQNPNFLILDEPTNDLDVLTINVLEEFLLDFPGCLVVVSHDRYFMDKIVDHLFVFHAGMIKDFPGNYSDYSVVREEVLPPVSSSDSEKVGGDTREKKKAALSYQEQKEFKRLERSIAQLEKAKKQLQKEFLKPLSGEEVTQKSIELQELSDKIDEETERWFELSLKEEG